MVEHDPTLFMLQSLYLALTTLVFALFFAEDTARRAEIVLQFYAASTVFAALAGIVGYFGVAGLGELCRATAAPPAPSRIRTCWAPTSSWARSTTSS